VNRNVPFQDAYESPRASLPSESIGAGLRENTISEEAPASLLSGKGRGEGTALPVEQLHRIEQRRPIDSVCNAFKAVRTDAQSVGIIFLATKSDPADMLDPTALTTRLAPVVMANS